MEHACMAHIADQIGQIHYNSYWRNATTPQPHYYTAGGTGSLVYSTISDAQSICSSTLDVSARLSNRTHQLSSSLILVPSPPATVHHHLIDQYNNILPMSSPSGTGAGTLGHHQTNSMAAATAQISAAIPAMPFCCECHATQNRCSTDSCPCFATRRMCDEHCESARYRGDCLNQAICKCSCEADPAKPAKNVCTKSCCDCLRIKESCSKLCACKQICKNKEPPKRAVKVNKPAQGVSPGLYFLCASFCLAVKLEDILFSLSANASTRLFQFVLSASHNPS
uniref:CRC domain-containing protein n=1 Tax=Globodera pallida TaxID=36090 RepID=A0A183CKI7_GLOPA